MSFLDMLNNPLPSARAEMYREFGDIGEDLHEEEPLDLDDNIQADDDDETFGASAFGASIGSRAITSPGSTLSPEEDEEADKLINLAATPVVLKEELSPEEITEFAESYEYQIACDEGFLLESCEAEFFNTASLVTEGKFYNKNMVRMTKEARTHQLFEICVQAIARAKNDPVYWKLHKVQIARRRLKGILRERYKGPAMKKAREYLIRLRASKSPILSKVGNTLDKR